jgi:hypothetical protein
MPKTASDTKEERLRAEGMSPEQQDLWQRTEEAMESARTIYGDLKISYTCPNDGKTKTRSVGYKEITGDRSGSEWTIYYISCSCGETHTVEC